jgi:hypothetical protein
MPKRPSDEPRHIQMPGTRTTTRCALCGAMIQPLDETSGKCGQCGAALHSCKQCTYFDTSARYECQQSIPGRIARKDAANECAFYTLRVRVERETGSGGISRPDDARKAFERLFKK